MTTRLAAPLGLALVLALCEPAVAAPQIRTERRCYPAPSAPTAPVAFTAGGLDAGRPYVIALDGTDVVSGTTEATGAVAATIRIPRLRASHGSVTHTLVVTEGANTATTTFGVARVFASFSPATGDPNRLRVRFAGTGFAMQKSKPNVYVHEVAPGGRVARTFALGRATGQCGTIAPTRRMRLFPTPPRHGAWHLQFDTSKAYHRGRAAFLYYTLEVTVSR